MVPTAPVVGSLTAYGDSMRSDAATPREYLAGLPDDRRQALARVRAVIRKNLPRGYQEAMNWGMIAYEVPLRTFPDTYNGQPLLYAALASQKQHMAVYLSGIYGSESLRSWFDDAYAETGLRMDVGKSCVRFRSIDDLPLALIGEAIAAVPVEEFIAMHEAAQSLRKARR